jgi:DNA primase
MRATPWSGFKFRYRIFTTEDGDKYGALYGLHQATDAIITDKTVYVVEGAMDALALAQVLPNTVAALTASLSERQAWTLSMLAENLVVVFDSDGPGVHGADKVVESYKPLFKRVEVKTLPYKDASETLGRLGLAKFRETVAARVRLTNFGKS